LGTLLRGGDKLVHPVFFGGRVAVLAGLAVWSCFFVFSTPSANAAGQSWLHGVNLIFHEAGHVIFGFFGDFLRVLGGTLGQVLMPAICAATLLLGQRDAFGASVALWWAGESLIDVAPYVYDARARELMLLGGVTGRDVPGYHDWNWLLGRLGWLGGDHGIAWTIHGLGVVLVLVALAWGSWVLLSQRRRLSWGADGEGESPTLS